MIKLTGILLTLFMFSCIPEESPITPIERGDLQGAELENSIYENTVYFSLDKSEFTGSHSQYNWTIAFSTSPTEHFVFLNSGITAKAAKLNTRDFESVNEDDVPDSLMIDDPAGGGLNTVFGEWWKSGSISDVFVVSAGVNERRRRQGEFKVQLTLNEDNTIGIKYQKFGEESMNYTIEKDNSRNLVHFSFGNGEQIINEPPKDSYDLIFTAKTEYVPLGIIDDSGNEETVQYQVRGVYLNPYKIEATEFANPDSLDFTEITYDDVSSLELTNNQNIIGYDWKQINIDQDIYSVDNQKYYIIQSQVGFLYKLRFIKFYNDFGERGFPEFEYKQL